MRVEARVVGKIDMSRYEDIVLKHERLRGVDYSGRTVDGFCAVGSRLEGCRFNNFRVRSCPCFGAGREMSEFVDCSFDGAHLDMGSGGCARFVRCSFRNVVLRDWRCDRVEMIDCVFSGRIKTAIFNGTVPVEERSFLHRERNEFHGNDFSGVDLIDVAFRRGIDLTQQRLPAGPQYLYLPDAAAALEPTESNIVGWQEGKQRQTAMAFIRGLCEDVRGGGQRQLLLRADNYYPYASLSREAIDKVFALLRPYAAAPGSAGVARSGKT